MTRPPHGDRPPDHDTEPDHHNRRSPADAGGLPEQLGLAELANAGVPDVVDGMSPVPISVWRLTDVGRPCARRPDSGLPPQLAVLLLGVFTRPGDFVVDVAADAALAGAARAGARRHRPVHDPAELTGPAGGARLALVPWPLPSPMAEVTETNDVAAATVLAACRRLLAADSCAIVVLVPAAAEVPYVDQAQVVIRAAHHAGLVYLQHIIVTTPDVSRIGGEVGDGHPAASDDEASPLSEPARVRTASAVRSDVAARHQRVRADAAAAEATRVPTSRTGVNASAPRRTRRERRPFASPTDASASPPRRNQAAVPQPSERPSRAVPNEPAPARRDRPARIAATCRPPAPSLPERQRGSPGPV
jgi:hypothetical protein